MKNNDSLYFGKECEHRVFSELLKLNYDVYSPIVDSHGIDCVIKKQNSKKYLGIQIKGRKPKWIFNIGKVDTDIDYFVLIPPDNNIYCVPSKQVIKWLNGGIKFNLNIVERKKIYKKYLEFKALI